MSNIRLGGYNMLPVVVKNLLIINALFYLATFVAGNNFQLDLSKILGLHHFYSKDFHLFQFVSYMFMHSSFDFTHILFNMFALWMFGTTLENYWGPKRFLIFYFVTGIGAAIIQMIVMQIQVTNFSSALPPIYIEQIINNVENFFTISGDRIYFNPISGINVNSDDVFGLYRVINTPVVGASGAVFGLLLAFGMIFPDELIYLNFLFPIKAKWFVAIYGVIELVSGISNSATDNVAHFAHLGGMLFGFILIKIWRNKEKNRYRIY